MTDRAKFYKLLKWALTKYINEGGVTCVYDLQKVLYTVWDDLVEEGTIEVRHNN